MSDHTPWHVFETQGSIPTQTAKDLAIHFESRHIYRDDFRWIVDSLIADRARVASLEAALREVATILDEHEGNPALAPRSTSRHCERGRHMNAWKFPAAEWFRKLRAVMVDAPFDYPERAATIQNATWAITLLEGIAEDRCPDCDCVHDYLGPEASCAPLAPPVPTYVERLKLDGRASLLADLDAALARVAQVEAALNACRGWWRHNPQCDWQTPCSCGFDALRAQVAAALAPRSERREGEPCAKCGGRMEEASHLKCQSCGRVAPVPSCAPPAAPKEE